jgi:hypothetical protein
MLNKNGRRNLDLEGSLIKTLVIENAGEKGITDKNHNIYSMRQNTKNYETENKRPITNNMIKSKYFYYR